MAFNYVMNFADEHNLFVDPMDELHVPKHDTILVNHYFNLSELIHFIKRGAATKNPSVP